MFGLGGDDENRQQGARIDFLEVFHHFEPVEPGHLQVEQDQVVPMLPVQGAHGARILGGGEIVVTRAQQHLLEERKVGGLVVDNQDRGLKNIR